MSPNMRWEMYQALLTIPPRLVPGVKEAVSGIHTKIPNCREADQYGCVAHLHTCAIITAEK